MKLEINYQCSAFALPGAVLSKLDTASDADLRLLLLLAGREDLRASFDPASAAALLSLDEKTVELSLSFWRGAGLIRTSAGKAKPVKAPEEEKPQPPATLYTVDDLPDYTGKELEELMKERADLSRLLKECQNVLGKVFNVSESNKMIALTDYLHLPDDYILLLCSYCKSRDKGSAAYVVTTAKALYNDDVVTTGALENYIEERERQQDFDNFMRHLLGLGGRKLSAKEKRFFESWQKSGLTNEVIAHAYEKSVDATGELSMPHLNKVIETYRKANVSSLEEAGKADEQHREEMRKLYGRTGGNEKGGKEDKSDFKTFEVDSFFDLAKKKSKEAAQGKT